MEPEDRFSSVELYRRGAGVRRFPHRYDFLDPLDRAIWSALQMYLDYLETADVEGEEPENVYGKMGTRKISPRTPRDLEERMVELRDAERGTRKMTPKGRFETALLVLEGLFAPAQEMSGTAPNWGDGEHGASRGCWEAGERSLEELEDGGGQAIRPEGGPWPASLTRVVQERPLVFPERVAPLFGLIQRSLRDLVSQSEAARMLDMTPTGIALRIERGEIRRIRVNGKVLVPEADLDVPKRKSAPTTAERAER